ncbi:UNKNOWN [Stylonychia lemnae]|uniref:Uncharacterized protein n=1 Tax=Stylonychia lemnae TaxID=5949 RepID=A0A078B969_STYLE|nr:UNKNOWN [Stylonychia lemnae]|eukprot:CDW90781.1 UNKNOWN [Stylonychia lemnae]
MEQNLNEFLEEGQQKVQIISSKNLKRDTFDDNLMGALYNKINENLLLIEYSKCWQPRRYDIIRIDTFEIVRELLEVDDPDGGRQLYQDCPLTVSLYENNILILKKHQIFRYCHENNTIYYIGLFNLPKECEISFDHDFLHVKFKDSIGIMDIARECLMIIKLQKFQKKELQNYPIETGGMGIAKIIRAIIMLAGKSSIYERLYFLKNDSYVCLKYQ